MLDDEGFSKAIGDLRAALADFTSKHKRKDLIENRDKVFARYQPIFSMNHIPDLKKKEFTSFLYRKCNRHWDKLYRQLHVADDIRKLRGALGILLNENKPIRDRFPRALARVKGLGHGIATAVLTVAYPERYGVWNRISEAGLKRCGLWPEKEVGESDGDRYVKMNDILKKIKKRLRIDLWTLDMLWWHLP